MTAQEKKLFKKKIDYFKSEKHIYKIKQPGTSFAVSSIAKTPTGFLKCNASVDFKRNILKSTVFTGDFFIYPRRTIFDIEAVLKNINFNKGGISMNKFEVSFDDVQYVRYPTILERVYQYSGIRGKLEENNLILEYKGSEMKIPFIQSPINAK